MGEALKFAKKLTKKSPLALREAKNAINNSMNYDIKAGCGLNKLPGPCCSVPRIKRKAWRLSWKAERPSLKENNPDRQKRPDCIARPFFFMRLHSM
jgi:hypothetical protein